MELISFQYKIYIIILLIYDEFDNKLFGISEMEAERMDPQQRFVLECVFMALQDGGMTRENVQGSKTAVFIGAMNADYGRMTSSHDLNNYNSTGGCLSIISARVSYSFDLRGPCMTINTACSSALLAIHLGSQALMAGDCDMAICGGVNCLLNPWTFVQLTKARMVSQTGQCQAFSANADGYARGEGCGIVLLKRLPDAIKAGDSIWATVTIGTNQDGRSVTPITAPSGEQQELLLKTVYERAGIDASEIDYIEAHGTGTKAGDPVEVQSLGKFFLDTQVQKKRYIGSVKTNIGHLESAAGIAGLIKVLLMMKHNKIVKSLLMGEHNPQIDFQKFCFEVPNDLKDWDSSRKRACINSFGFGGINCHAVVSSYAESKTDVSEENMSQMPLLFCFSGQNMQGLKESIQEFVNFAKTQNEKILKAISYSSTVRRDHFQVRKAVTADSLKELVDKLIHGPLLQTSRRHKVTFVFGGMSTAWNGMCKELISEFKIFKVKIQEIDNCLKHYVSWSLYDRLLQGYNVDDTIFGPIAIFACQVALTTLWEYLGIKADCVLGQSMGEVAASLVAGVWSLNEAVNIIYHRTSVLAEATGGKMLMIRNSPVQQYENLLSQYEGKANIALQYSPMSCTISGDVAAVDQIEKDLLVLANEQNNPIFTQHLKVSTAFHSHYTEASKKKILRILDGMQGSTPNMELISTVSGEKAQETDFSTPNYWGKNIREPVLFGKAVVNAVKVDSVNIFVEIGPKPVLSAHIKDLFTDYDNKFSLPSMKPNFELKCLIETAGKMYEHGINLNWNALYAEPQPNTESPKYSFCRIKCLYISEDIRQELMGVKASSKWHPFLKTIHNTGSSYEHKIIVSPESIATVFEHRFSGTILIPGALFAEVGLGLAHHYFSEDENQKCTISLKFKQPVVLQKEQTAQLDIDVNTADMPGSFSFVVCKNKQMFAEGKVDWELSSENLTIDINDIKRRCKESLSKEKLYTKLRHIGMTFGEVLQIVGESVKSETESLSTLSLNSTIKNEMKETTMHPAILDAMLQTTGGFYDQTEDHQKSLPVQIEGLRISRHVEDEMFVHTRVLKKTNSFTLFHIGLLSLEGHVIAEIETFVTKILDPQNEEMVFQTKWCPIETLLTNDYDIDRSQKWLIVADQKQNDATSSHIYLEYLDHDNDLNEILQAKAVDLEKLSAIVFLCQQQIEDTSSSEKVLEIITRQSMNLRGLLMYLNMHNANLPLFIITENAMHTGNKITPINLVAGSTWGFVRSVLREQIYSAANIVDVHTDTKHTFDTLMTAAVRHLLQQNNHRGLNEFVIEENTILCQQLFLQNDMPTYRHNKIDTLCKANLFSRNKGCICKPYFQYDNQDSNTTLPQFVEIMTTQVVIHDLCLYPNCVPVHQVANYASNVITLETVGNVSENGLQNNMAVFFPCIVGTLMKVPQQCIIDINKVPGYQPGILTKLVLLWHHCMLIDKQMEIFILCSDATKPVASALNLMLETENKNTKIQIVDINNATSIQYYSETTIVSTIELNKHAIEAICNSWPNADKLVCMEQIVPRDAGLQFCYYNPRLQIKIVRASDICTCRSAMDNMPKLIMWIVNHKDVVGKISQEFQNLTFPQTEISAANLMQCSTIPLSGNESGIPNVHAFEDSLIRPDGIYIAVGGLTGLGWECVCFLATKGAGTIMIINRRKAQEDKLHEIRKLLANHHCQIQCIQADVTDMKSLKQAFKTIDNKFPRLPIKGVFFGAAVLEDRTMINMTQDVFVKAAAPKIQGAWNMHLLTANMPLDFFIMHSSVTAVFGNAGQSNYGAANAFQDSLAQKRRQTGLVGQSINWGPLKLGMLQDKPDLVRSLETQGYIALNIDEIHKCLLSALMLDKPTIVPVKFDTNNLYNSLMKEKSMALEFKLSSILEPSFLENTSNTTSKSNLDVEQLKSADTDTRIKTITAYITKLLSDVLSCDPDLLELDKGVVNLGLDSMQAMTMNNRIHQTFQVQITPNDLLHLNFSANKITELINSKLFTHPESTGVLSSFFEQTLTYMEYMYYKVYCENPAHPCLYYVNEISMIKSVGSWEILMKLLDTLMSRHEVLRTTFEEVPQSDNIRWNVKRKVNPVGMKPDLRIVKAEDTDEIERHTTEAFHLETQGPLRFIFIDGETCYFRMVFKHVCFDADGIAAMFTDIMTTFVSAHRNMTLPDQKTKGGSLIVVEMEKMLQEKDHELKEFWKHFLDVNIPAITFGKPEQGTEMKHETFKQETLTLEPSVYDALLDIAKSEELSMFKLMTSVYQLLLHLIFNETNVAILTIVDIKQYIPNLSDAVGLGANYIPLLAKFPSDVITIKEYLKSNKTSIESAIDHCVCPLDIIDELIGSEKISNICRNSIVMIENDFESELLKNFKEEGFTFNVTKSDVLGSVVDTELSLVNRKKEKKMILEFMYNTNVVSNTRAKHIMEAFQEIVTKLASNLSMTTVSLQDITSIKKLVLERSQSLL